MNAWFETFSDSVRRHGWLPSLSRSCYNALRRFLAFEICRVESNLGQSYPAYEVAGYETRTLDSDAFHNSLCDELAGTDFHWAFERGDQCNASLFNGEVVGYNFNTNQPTPVLPGIEFCFPSEYVYSFASRTAPSHRGKKLERNRWKVGEETRQRLTGSNPLRIWYMSVVNLEAAAANRNSPTGVKLWGYTGYVRLFGTWHCFNSPGCRKLGAGFARSGPKVSPIELA